MEVSIMGVNVPPFFETDHRSSIHPASFILYSNRVAVPEMIPYWQGDGLIIRPVYLLFLPKTVRKFVGMTICAGDGKMLRRTLHIKIQTDQQRIKAAIADNAAFQADAGQQLRRQNFLPLPDSGLRCLGPGVPKTWNLYS